MIASQIHMSLRRLVPSNIHYPHFLISSTALSHQAHLVRQYEFDNQGPTPKGSDEAELSFSGSVSSTALCLCCFYSNGKFLKFALAGFFFFFLFFFYDMVEFVFILGR